MDCIQLVLIVIFLLLFYHYIVYKMDCIQLVLIVIFLLLFFPISNKKGEEKLTSSDSRVALLEDTLWIKNCNENLSGKGYDYRGCQNKTKSGYLCQRWDRDTPHSRNTKSRKNYKKKRYGVGNHNYCRNADNSSGPWCYTTDPKKRWEYCDTRKCGDETLRGWRSINYRGCQNKTKTGYTCQRWDKDTPHNRNNKTKKHYRKGERGLGTHNYCRNPDDSGGGIWCYTDDKNKRWEYCTPKTKYKAEPIIIDKTKENAGCSSDTKYDAGKMSLDKCAIYCSNGVKGAKANSFSYGRDNQKCWCSPGICKEVKNNKYDRYYLTKT